MTVSWRPQPGSRRRLASAPLSRVMVAVVLVSLLAACGPEATDEDDREFANLTPPAVKTATTAIIGSPIASTGDEAMPALATPDPARLFTAPTAPATGFFVLEGELLLVGDDGAIRRVELGGPVDAFSGAPGGGFAAVIFRPDPANSTPGTPDAISAATPSGDAIASLDGPRSVAVIGGDGTVVRQVDDVVGRLSATPSVRDALPGDLAPTAVALGPGPDDLLVAFQDGLLVRLPVDGEPAMIRGSGNLAELSRVVWSPDGKGLALVAAERPGEPAAVYFTALRPDGVDPVRVAPAPGRTAGEIAWLPDASGILFVDAAGPLDVTTLRSGRDLFVTPLRSDQRSLVAAAGVIGPAAGVVQFAASPNGAVAYTLYRAEGEEVRFNSLWVGSIDGRAAFQVSLPDDIAVQGLAWTVSGLVVLAQPVSGGPPVALRVDPDGVARPASDAVLATPAT